MMVRVPRVARRGPRKVELGPPMANSCVESLPSTIAPAAAQARDAHRIGRGDIVGQDLRMAGCRQSRDIDDVLDPDRHPVQRPPCRPARNLPPRRPWPAAIAASRSRRMNTCSFGSSRSMRCHSACSSSTGDSFLAANRPRRLRRRHPVQVAHKPAPVRIGGQGSARGSAGALILAAEPLACSAATATSSGNSCQRLFEPGAPRQQFASFPYP